MRLNAALTGHEIRGVAYGLEPSACFAELTLKVCRSTSDGAYND